MKSEISSISLKFFSLDQFLSRNVLNEFSNVETVSFFNQIIVLSRSSFEGDFSN